MYPSPNGHVCESSLPVQEGNIQHIQQIIRNADFE